MDTKVTAKMEEIAEECYENHKIEIKGLIDQGNLRYLKRIRRNIQVWVTLPVGLLIALGIFILTNVYEVGRDAAAHKALTEVKIDVASSVIMDEARLRREGDEHSDTERNKMEGRLNERLNWLYENSIFKKRGGNLPYLSSNK